MIVGVMRTVTVRRGDPGTWGRDGLIIISASETTASDPSEIGCSGSDMVETRSKMT